LNLERGYRKGLEILDNDKFHNLYSSRSTLKATEPKAMRRTRYVARMEEIRNVSREDITWKP
jgi:hypothetical protein